MLVIPRPIPHLDTSKENKENNPSCFTVMYYVKPFPMSNVINLSCFTVMYYVKLFFINVKIVLSSLPYGS